MARVPTLLIVSLLSAGTAFAQTIFYLCDNTCAFG